MNSELKKLIKNLFFFEASNESIKVFRYLIFSTITYHFISWFLLRIFGTNLWQNGDKSVFIFNLVDPALDGGYLEHFGNIMLFWCFFITSYISIKKFHRGFYISLVYLFLFVDDSLAIHESFPGIVYSFISKININDNSLFFELFFERLIEVSFWLLPIGILTVGIKKNLKYKLTNPLYLKFQITNIFFFFLFALFGIVLDQITFILGENWEVTGLFLKAKSIIMFSLIYIEEYGEIISIFFAFIWMMNFLANLNEKKLN